MFLITESNKVEIISNNPRDRDPIGNRTKFIEEEGFNAFVSRVVDRSESLSVAGSMILETSGEREMVTSAVNKV